MLRRRLLTWVVRRGFDALARNDVEGTLLAYEPDIQCSLSGAGLGLAEHYSGHQGQREFFGDVYENFAHPRYTVKRMLDSGDRLVAEFDFVGTGKASGAEVALHVGTVHHLSPGGKIARQDIFWQDGWKHALEAAGLSE